MDDLEPIVLALLERGEETINLPLAWATITSLFKGPLDIRRTLTSFDELKKEAIDYVGSEDQEVLARLNRLNEFFVRHAGFHGNQAAYASPCNSYLDDVLESRLGIPISLSVIFMELGRAVGLTIDPIGFPAHFLVAERSEGILCDPFHGQIGLQKADCLDIARRILGKDFVWDDGFLAVADNTRIILRMLNNLRNSYLTQGDLERRRRAERLLQKIVSLDVPKYSLSLN